jgi:hypothetical protein
MDVSRAGFGERRLLACRSRQLAETGQFSNYLRITCAKVLPAALPATTGWQPVLPSTPETRVLLLTDAWRVRN